MGWGVVKNIDHTIRSNYVNEPTRYWKADASAWYLKGIFLIHTTGKLYKDSGNPTHYRIACSIYVQHVFNRIGGYWEGNSGDGVTVEFNGNQIFQSQITTPLSCWNNNSYSDVHVISLDKDFTIDKAGYLDVIISVYYGGATRIGSPNNVPSSLKPFTSVDGFTGTYTNFIDYEIPDPYKPSTIWLNPNDYTKIARVGVGPWSVHYSYNAGSNKSVPISLAIHDYGATSWGVRWEPVLRNVSGSSSGVWDSYTLGTDRGFTNGNRYRITLVSKGGEALSPSSWNPQEGLIIYTYQEPKINTSLTISRSSQHANQDNKFTISGTNNRAWSSYENEFQTHYRIKKGSDNYTSWINLGNISSWSRTAAEMRSLIPKTYDGLTNTIQFKRYSPSPSWYSSNTASANFTVYYRPQIAIISSNVTYKTNGSSGSNITKGQILNSNSLSQVYVSWTYDTDQAKAGYTQGYRIRLYNKNNSLVKTYYTSSKYISIPKADIPKMQKTYIDITPYYKNDTEDTSNFWYYDGTIASFEFVELVTNLNTPVITYPVNNSNWINKDFRICFTLPEDPDKGNEPGEYRYENIELEINNSYIIKLTDSTATSSDAVSIANAFSAYAANLTYKRNIVIYPNVNGTIPSSTSYKLRIRVKKKYDAISTNNYGWSNWSDYCNITVTEPSYSIVEKDIIRASHFNNMKSTINRIRNTYGVTWSNAPTDAIVGNTIIQRSQYNYEVLFNQLVLTKNKVNTFTTFDNTKPKFDINDSLPETFTPIEEYITNLAEEDIGRNYIQIAYDRCKLLK